MRTYLAAAVDGVVHHDTLYIGVLVRLSTSAWPVFQYKDMTRLQDGLLNVDTDTLAVHARARLAHEPQLKVDPDLLACLLGELVASARIPILLMPCTHLGVRPGIVLLGSQDTDEVRRAIRERLRGRHVQELALEWDDDLAGSNEQALRGGHDGLVIREKLDRISLLAVGTAMLAGSGQCSSSGKRSG